MINCISMLIGKAKSMASLSVLFAVLISCNQGKNSKKEPSGSHNNSFVNEFTLTSPSTNQLFPLKDPITISLQSRNKKTKIDSVKAYLQGKPTFSGTIKNNSFSFILPTDKVGRHDIRVRVFFDDSLSQSLSTQIISLANTPPEKLHYKLLNKYPHDTNSYIEGLVYYNGELYESSGRQEQSKLREIEPATGKVLMERDLADKYFGEGITILHNRIYQLTYVARIGFVYDLKTFELIRRFNMQTAQGWGLTNDGKSLIASDGSSTIYFYDPEYYNQTGQLDVADNKGLKKNINELEYVNGYIWANVYGETDILKIDAKTGQIVATVDLHKLVPKGIPHTMDYVLNGIAYNAKKNTFYVTGKLWPTLYEISIY